MKRKILAFFGAVLITAGMMNLGVSRGAWAGGCDKTILGGMVAWYNGLECDPSSGISPNNFATGKMPETIGKIAGNVLQDLFFAVGVLAVGFGIYAGFLMITAQGDVGQTERAKKTLTRSIIGLVIAILATTIVAVIRLIFWK